MYENEIKSIIRGSATCNYVWMEEKPIVISSKIIAPILRQFPEKFKNMHCKVRDISSGLYHVLIVVDNIIYGMGSNCCGQLGDAPMHVPSIDDLFPLFTQELNEVGQNIRKIYCLKESSIVLFDNHKVYTCGSNRCGEIGQFYNCVTDLRSVQHFENSNIKSIWCGFEYTIYFDGFDYYWFGKISNKIKCNYTTAKYNIGRKFNLQNDGKILEMFISPEAIVYPFLNCNQQLWLQFVNVPRVLNGEFKEYCMIKFEKFKEYCKDIEYHQTILDIKVIEKEIVIVFAA